jgi:hypothetical protein
MEENSITETILRTGGLLLIVGVVVLLGWNEPLKYRFMSRAEIHALENPGPSGPPPRGGAWMWQRGDDGKLDRGAYNRTGGARGQYGGGASHWGR